MFKRIDNIVILTDMDGTFLPSDKIPSKRNLLALENFKNAGGRFSIATGRALQAANQYFDVVKVNFPAILCNGGLIYDIQEAKELGSVYLPENARDITRKILEDNADIGCEVVLLSDLYVPQMNKAEAEHNTICKIVPTLCTSIDEVPDNWYKVLFADEQERMDELEKYVSDQGFSGVDFVRSAKQYFEILPLDVSKGYGVEFLRDTYCKKDDIIVCMGDYNNDIEMLKAADIAVCPSNAVDEVKKICDIVLKSSCDEDAFAELIDIIFKESQH